MALLALLTGGCANIPSVGPDYHQPAVSTPARWGEPLNGGETNVRRSSPAGGKISTTPNWIR